ncbi:hypothetical protein Pmar_PMAR023775 [Perkinsus marinus ATCC 50983]|uniref:Heparan-alpha-glucosaminide N-acetyltransferase catalytic domain-containing protein n=1 Tax=Perkinsus marinus (strain ATCC 50983 / TXsc) TaxID=423536 RepID=C5KCI3_PERM5|nr:hypothetical protein Pmar_PMAR023775 [Perkinsus marinus ATCC 50983]EER17845.1 hypothetical protein Pmar_PMAR023775 [Perkinsus marinus ATCC 50983]|eukprot:XP_002786049.1 hypothetical protein Pmar_PMAR023775 [Perkinsus marinus ATCC 50983]
MTQVRAPSSSVDSSGLLLPPTRRTTTPDRPRIVAVDVMRGRSSVQIVDVCGKTVPSIGHAPWNGLHLADIVMPGFIFIDTLTLGLDLYTFRAPGILQRIAVCYAAAVLLRKLVSDLSPNDTVKGALKNNSRVLLMGLLCIIINWAIMLLGPQPEGCSRGSLTPQCNVASNIDRMVFGPEHMYSPLWDPEGLLSTLPTLATVALGLACGKFIQSRPSHTELLRLVGCGLLLALSGMALGIVIPGYTQAPVMLTYALLQLGLWMWICRWLSMRGIFVTI